MSVCQCGRSPTNLCIGWHNLTEEEYRKNKKKYEKCVKSVKKGLKEAAKDYVWGIKKPQRVANKFDGWGSVKIKVGGRKT